MIGFLKGEVLSKNITNLSLILNVSGVGYLVFVTQNVLEKVSKGKELELFVETLVREDAITLYGFEDLEEKNTFNLLKTVQGVGAKASISCISFLGFVEVQKAIASANSKMLEKVPGIGAKVAGRIIAELKGKIERIEINEVSNINNIGSVDIFNQAVSALENFGYKNKEAQNLVYLAFNKLEEKNNIESLIKEALKLAQSK